MSTQQEQELEQEIELCNHTILSLQQQVADLVDRCAIIRSENILTRQSLIDFTNLRK
jgi:hypothetical protein